MPLVATIGINTWCSTINQDEEEFIEEKKYIIEDVTKGIEDLNISWPEIVEFGIYIKKAIKIRIQKIIVLEQWTPSLYKLINKISDEINKQSFFWEREYIWDLILLESEKKIIFNNLKKENLQLFIENNINTFLDFNDLLGIAGYPLFNEAKKKNPNLTELEYLDFLAIKLNTPEKLHIFWKLFIKYDYDQPNIYKNKISILKNPDWSEWEYNQSFEETIKSIAWGKIREDCDGQWELFKKILKRQGKTAYLMYISYFNNIEKKFLAHAFSVWVEKNKQGLYDGYSMWTYGLDKNWNQYWKKVDKTKENGYKTIEEALNSLMLKYEQAINPSAQKVDYYKIRNWRFQILYWIQNGKEKRLNISTELFFNKEVVEQRKIAMPFKYILSEKEINESIGAYENLISLDPKNWEFYRKQINIRISKKKNGGIYIKKNN